MTRDLHVIVNPMSGNGRARRMWPTLSQRMRSRGFTVWGHVTGGPGEATRIARDLIRDGARELAVVGGDGTVNETVNGCFDPKTHTAADVVLSVIPCGTGRDFARSLGIRTAEQAVDLLEDGSVCPVDVGVISYQDGDGSRNRYFVNVADVGLGAETAAFINRSSKALGGFLAYLVGAARTILVFQGRHARVTVDGVLVHDGETSMVVLANGRFHAGGMDIAPMASMTDGQFDILILHRVSKAILLGSLLPRVYRGTHIGHRAVRHLKGRAVEIQAVDHLPFEVDGEQPGTTDLRAEVLPRALRVRVPPSDS